MGRKQEEYTGEAPLEQNEKNLECDGVHYKVVLEQIEAEKRKTQPQMFNVSDQIEFNFGFCRLFTRTVKLQILAKPSR